MLIRVNGVHTPWGEADLEAAALAAPDGVLLPKVDGPGTVMHAARILRKAPEKTRLWAMMETPHAMLNAASIASIAADPASRLEALVLGLNDLAKETRARMSSGRAAFAPWLATCVAAARAHGCDVIDGVYNDIKDLAGFAAECRQGLEFGFDGKTLIHPGQVDICNGRVRPDPGRDRAGPRRARRLRSARKCGQGRVADRRPHGGAVARANGQAHAGDRRFDRGAERMIS